MTYMKKVGRTAHEFLRDQAKKIADSYRPVFECTEESYCPNPDDNPEDQIFISHRHALGCLLGELEAFAQHGEFTLRIDMKKFDMREKARMLNANGWRRVDMNRSGILRGAVV
ncbi:hypothetical protein [Duganella fentianensis]|uniref:hypothetical protein n=1 Tax=Duganella fentianensis TaxID=2692177 RepID=UPI0032B1C9A3